ncbi:MAG: DUF4412 domain-containing protein [Planctomycetota bacterium]|nr:DUF4412 domain-containing protein [Planctomycetota bacterium]
MTQTTYRGYKSRLAGVLVLSISFLWTPTLFADVTLLAESNGFPGASTSNDAMLRIAVKKSSMRIINSAQFHVVTIDMEKNVFREFSAYHKVYEQKTASSFEKLRQKREAQQRKQIDEVQKLSDKEKAQALKELREDGIELNGKIVAKTERTTITKDFRVRIDGVMRNVKCTRLLIRENNARLPAFELWVTKDIPVKENFLRFYELGTFSKAVIAELKKITDFPVRIEALVDTGSVKKRIHCEIKDIETEAIPAWGFDVPKKFKKVADLAEFLKNQEAIEQGPKLNCADCSKLIPVRAKADTWVKRSKSMRKKYWFCNSECRKRFMAGTKWRTKK